ncbi:MAG: DUF4917 family protein [Solirubrobacterales bacterium]
MSTEPIDGSLASWSEIADAEEWQALLLGNGLSIGVWPKFDYGSLYEHAQDGTLTTEDRALFGSTSNFERVLADLNVAIRICDSLGIDTAPQRLLFFDATTHPLGLSHLASSDS